MGCSASDALPVDQVESRDREKFFVGEVFPHSGGKDCVADDVGSVGGEFSPVDEDPRAFTKYMVLLWRESSLVFHYV